MKDFYVFMAIIIVSGITGQTIGRHNNFPFHNKKDEGWL